MYKGAIKCLELIRNINGEGRNLVRIWHCITKAWGSKRIRYPRSPSRKRWILFLGC